MNLLDLISSCQLQTIIEKYNTVRKDKDQVGYNLFTISSYNSYLENFHSDILASLFNPKGLHQEGAKFLHLFLSYLNSNYQTNLLESHFNNTIVTREKGRLDIWIRDETSKSAIIIENKINNAEDMDMQIDRYFCYSEDKGYNVLCIVYLSLDGTKIAPPTIKNIGHLVQNIGAFTNDAKDLTNGWLVQCFETSSNRDSQSLIWQYIKLIKHLSNLSMDNNTMYELYKFLSSDNRINTVETLIQMFNNLSKYRADIFGSKLKDYSPFQSQYRYKDNYWLYDRFKFKGENLKLDIWFDKNGNANLVLWNTTTPDEAGRIVITQILSQTGLINQFSDHPTYNGNGYSKYFIVGNDYSDMMEIDAAIFKFTQDLLIKLKSV